MVIVMEGILKEAPLRCFPGICPNRWENVSADRQDSVVVFGGWDVLPVCFGGGLGFLSACSCFLDSAVSGGWGVSPPALTLSLALGV